MSSRRDGGASSAAQASAPRQNEYFVPRDGIDREVITADICRYLGNDALVRPGNYTDPTTGQMMQGYRVTAYRALTTAMIQDLKNDSARWEQERRSHSGGSGARYSDSSSRFNSTTTPAQYPGNDAPGYSGAGAGPGGAGFPYDNRQAPYGNPQYATGQAFTSQAPDSRYNAQSGQGAYTQGPYGATVYSSEGGGPPYLDVGAHQTSRSGRPYPDSRMSASAYQPQSQGAGYYGQGQYQGGHPAQPLDTVYGRGNTYATTQQDYNSSGPPVYQYDPQPQYDPASQNPLPRATTSSPTSTPAQTGNSGTSHSHRHRDRDTRDGSYSKSDRHRRAQ
ncbi:putative Hkr1 [Cryphonectria parasitica EP155]|uniref:Hkr1 n=1 Tax=Cryphonectria parasitica (strain ATCC 38755 / EP155) TaxID=660469 RepID=A0A9P4XSJ1_CRYP1|nr:putative Hkr1 [Cryphonectria parasitica EP155]KAF3760124.1 putative Hkr1 [Cryphonectria parasitica EP155]